MTITPSPYEIIRAIQDAQRVTDRLTQMLVLMLDKSAPEPLLSSGPPALREGEFAPTTVQRPERRATGESARPSAVMMLDGVQFVTTERRARLIKLVQEKKLGVTDMVRHRIAASADAARKLVKDTNEDLEKAGLPYRVGPVERIVREGQRGGQIAPRYGLIDITETVSPGILPAAQDEAAADERSDQEAPASAAGEDADRTAHGAPFVTSPGEGEGVAASVDPSPAADVPIPVLAPAPPGVEARPPEAALPPAEPPADDVLPSKGELVLDMWANTNFTAKLIAEKAGCAVGSVSAFVSIARKAGDPRAAARTPEALAQRRSAERAVAEVKAAPDPAAAALIEPGDLIAVDIKLRRIHTRAGSYEVGGVNLARALDFMRGGSLYGFNVIAKRGGWPSADVARTALAFERKRLAEHGIDLWTDKFNARLREAQ